MSCLRITKTNDTNSLLFDKLLSIVKDEQLAHDLYAYFDVSEGNLEFKEIFGDYLQDYKKGIISDRIDENGEPKLFYNTVLNKHYFLDKENEPVYYPYTRQGLGKSLSTVDIKLMAKIMALKFYETNVDFDFSNLEFTSNSNITLEKFIEEFLAAKINELSGNPDFRKKARGIALNQTTEDVKEWVNEVKDFYQTLKLIYKDENDSELISDEENEIRGEVFRKESFLKSSKNNVNNNIKLFLALMKTSELNNFNEYNFVSFNDIYSSLNKTLSNIVPTINEEGNLEDPFYLYLDEIKKLIKLKPNLQLLYTELQKKAGDDIFMNQFVSAFNLHKNNFLGSEIYRGPKGSIEYTVRNLSEVGVRKGSILTQWYHNFQQQKLDKKKLKEIKSELEGLYKQFQANDTQILSAKMFEEYQASAERILMELGVNFTKKGFEFFLGNLSLDEVTLDIKKDKLKALLKNASYAIEATISSKEDINPFTQQNIFRQLAEAEAFFMEEGTDASIFTLGKTKWNYSMPSHIDLLVGKWKKNPALLHKLYLSTKYSEGSYYMRYLLALDVNGIDENRRKALAQERINNIEIGIFNSVQQRGDATNASDNNSLSLTDSLVDYINKLLGNRKPNGKTYHKTAIAADKSTEYQIHYGVDTLQSEATMFNKKVEVAENVLDIFYTYFKSEYERMAYEHAVVSTTEENELTPNYHLDSKNAFKSQLFPSMSISYDIDGNVILPILPNGLELYDSQGIPLYTNLDEIKDKVIRQIEDSLSNGIKKTLKGLVDNKVFTFNEVGSLQNNAIDSIIYNSYIEEGLTKDEAALRIAGDIFINSVSSQVEFSKMFTGDIAYYANIMDYKKRVPATYTDGLYMRLVKGEEKFNASIIQAVNVAAPSLKNLKTYLSPDAYKHYERVNSTDAQAWITPQRWEFIMRRIGKFTAQHEVIYNKMLQDNPIFDKQELKLLAQPLKGVYFDMQEDGKPVYLKYSQAVLLPGLIKNTGLETLYNKMTQDENGKLLVFQDQIHELIVEDGIKVGRPVAVKTHDEQGDVNNDFILNKISLNNSGWKLQQDLPVKGIKPTDIGTQIQVNIFQGLTYNDKTIFDISGKDMSNTEVIDYLNNITGILSVKGLNRILHKLGVDPFSSKITNEHALYDSIIKQLKTRDDVPNNFIKALEAGISPYGIPGSFQMFQNVFSSLVNSEVIKIKTNGGGFIQMADYGLSYNEAKTQNIKFTPWFTKGKKTAKLHSPEMRIDPITGKEILVPGAIFISGSFIAKYIPNYKNMSPQALFGTYNETTGKYEGGKIDQKILTNIIGYRIPNQGLPSNDALMIAGILPEAMGDTVVAYTGMTAKTGSDFDIDKMYLMLASFTPKYTKTSVGKGYDYIKNVKLTTRELKNELSAIGHTDLDDKDSKYIRELFIEDILLSGNTEQSEFTKDFQDSMEIGDVERLVYSEPIVDNYGEEYPLHVQPLAVVQNKLIEAYKNILLNKDVINDVMNSIDLKDIQNDIMNLLPAIVQDDLMDFDAITDLELKQQFSSGKAGLGQNVNASQDAVKGAMAEQSINEFYIGWGNSNAEGNTVLDKQFSVTLSEKDIKGYVKSFNTGLPKSKHITYQDVKAKMSLNSTMMQATNGFVDIAKNPFIVRGNWVTRTNNTVFMLLRAGVHPFYVNAFIAQPILREYVKFIDNMESNTIQDTGKLLGKFKLQKAVESFKKDDILELNNKEVSYQNLFRTSVTFDNLKWIGRPDSEKYEANLGRFAESIKKSLIKVYDINTKTLKEDKELNKTLDNTVEYFVDKYHTFFEATPIKFDKLNLEILRNQIKGENSLDVQLTVLNLFENLKTPSKNVNKGVKATRITVEGKGKNINSLIIANNRVNNMLLNTTNPYALKGFEGKLVYNNKNTVFGHLKQNSIDAIYKIMRENPKYFLSASNSVVSTFNEISSSVYGHTLENEDLGDKLEKAYHSYIISGFPALKMSTEERTKLLQDFPIVFMKFKETSNNPLVKELIIKEGSPAIKFFISMPNLRKGISLKNTLTEGWKELMETNPEIAENLIKYSYAITGFNNSINQFHEFIPYEWFNKNRFNSYLKRLELNQEFIDENFINQFLRNNHLDRSLVKNIFISQVDLKTTDGMKTTFTMRDVGKSPHIVLYSYTDEQTGDTYKKYFRLLGYNNGKAVYIRTSVLGYRDAQANTIVEYDITTSMTGSGLSSVSTTNQITTKQIDTTLLSKTLSRTDLTKEFDPDAIVTEESIQQAEVKTKIKPPKGKKQVVAKKGKQTKQNDEIIKSITEERSQMDFQIREKYFPTNTQSSTDILNKIAKSKHPLAELAKKLLEYNVPVNLTILNAAEYNEATEYDDNFAGRYHAGKNFIEINENGKFRGLGSEPTIIHEIIHAYTVNYMKDHPSKKAEMEKFLEAARNYKDRAGTGEQDAYSFKDVDEFVVGLFTDANLIKALKNIPAIEAKKYDNLFEEVYDYILELFAISKQNETLYGQAFALATNIIVDNKNNIDSFNSSEIKPGVSELFESNPELANSVYEPMGFKNGKADVILPIGTSGSGKSTFIKTLAQDNLVVISPDEMRVEFTRDINNKSKDVEIYEEAAKRTVQAIKDGKQVVFDTTNLSKDKRRPFVDAIKKALPNANIQYKLMELNPELAKQRIKAQIARGENRANVPDSAIDRHAESYKEMLEDIKSEDISNYEITPQQKEQAQQAYSNYLDTVFPDSKVKDILYHGTGSSNKIEKLISRENRIYLSDELTASAYAAWDEKNRLEDNNNAIVKAQVIPVIINLENPVKLDGVDYKETEINKEGDGIIGLNIKDPLGGVENQYVVRNSEQVLVLGSKQDIKGFKEFTTQSTEFDYELDEQWSLDEFDLEEPFKC